MTEVTPKTFVWEGQTYTFWPQKTVPDQIGGPTVDVSWGYAPERDYAGRWTASKHPRWPKGTPKGGKFLTKGEMVAREVRGLVTRQQQVAAAREVMKAVVTRTAVTHHMPIPKFKDPKAPDAIDCGDDVEKAVRLLGEGKAVQLHQPRQVSVLLDKLAAIAQDAEAKGEKAPNYDLCKVTVKGTSLFCAGSTLLGRNLMPQLKSATPKRGSPAAKKPRNQFGEVDLTQDFLAELKKRGYKGRNEMEHAAKLKATQNELNGRKTANIMGYVRTHPTVIADEGPLIVTEEGYILDGHHRWAALVGLDAEDGRLGNDKQIPVVRMNMTVVDLLYEALQFTIDQGISPASFSQGTGGG